MSVTLEKRRKVAELEDFEKRILQEKRRLLRELESLEKPFRNTRTTRWMRNVSSNIAGEWRAACAAAQSRAPMWFYVLAAIILLGGGGFVAHLALSGAPQQRADVTALRQPDAPSAPAQPAVPAPDSRAAQIDAIALAAAPMASAKPAQPAAPAPDAADATALREARVAEAPVAAEPFPEPLSPPTKTDTPAAAPALGAVAAPPLDAAPARPKTAFDDAPPVAAAADAVALAEADDNAPAARVSQREDETAGAARHAKCFVKVDGRVLFERSCMLRQPNRSVLTLNAGDDAIVLKLEHGRTWMASLGGRSLGKVYRTGQCWGRRRQVYICAKGA